MALLTIAVYVFACGMMTALGLNYVAQRIPQTAEQTLIGVLLCVAVILYWTF